MPNLPALPELGFGLGLRPPHYAHIFEHWPAVDWFEIISENFMDTDGRPKRNLARIRERYPVVMHGVALSIGTVDPLNSEYLTKLKALIDFVEPAWVSDHLCWTGIAHKNTHDLLPVPYTEEALKQIVDRIGRVQDFLGRPIALENPSTYLEFKSSEIPEAEFIAQMAQQSGCQLLLDVNNVYVSCFNHRLDPKAYIDALPLDRVVQVHLSGHRNMGTHIIDTHDDFVVDEVWSLYRYAAHKAGRRFNTMVEWDDKIPEFPVLAAELEKARLAANDAQHYAPLPELAQVHIPLLAITAAPLVEEQARMQEAILLGTAEGADGWIRAKETFSAADQLGVYANAYRYRLHDVVAEDYPVLEHYLGADAFHAHIDEFVETVPSSHFNVGRYSADLPAFLMGRVDAFAQELTELENVVCQLTDPAETTPLSPRQLEGLTPEALMRKILRPRTALQLLSFTYPVNDYFIAVKEERSPQKPLPRQSFLAVFRHDDVVWRMKLGEDEYHLLQTLFSGVPVGQALESLEEAATGNLSAWFARWMRNGLLAA